MAEQDKRITDTIARERARLRGFIRLRVPDPGDAEDILQDVFYELVAAYRLPEPIEQAGAWMLQVARNRITDLFRKRKTEPLPPPVDDDDSTLDDLLPSADAGPEAAYLRARMLEALQRALAELPPEQREVFIAHELEGRSFGELAETSGTALNTLLARKRYAVLALRGRLREIYESFDFT